MARKPEPALRVRAMQCLARREHSRAELRARLLPHVAEGDDVEALLDELALRNWLSDERAAEQVVSQRRNRFGTQRIAHELRQKGIAENLIEAALPQLQETELEAVRAVWQKKFGSAPRDAKEMAKQVRFLQSRGFALDVVLRMLRAVESESSPP
ncbi:MAG: recombination regulator RecX [Nitrosomonadales bacterium]|nr:recombination regulator RecX [Nitrosomonadales bacterium]